MKKVDAGATKGLVKARRPAHAQAHDAAGRAENSLLRLQQGLGNRAMGELLGGLQRQPEEEEEPLQGKADLQRQGPEEEEPLQGKADLQRQGPEEEEPLQGKEEVQTKSPEGEEEEEAGEEEEFEEEALQGKPDLQRQGPEEEEPLQGQADLQRQGPEEEEEQLQGKADKAEVMGAIESRRGGGQQLEAGVRRQAEAAFGYDFRDVRVHTDSEADGLARGLQAKAFTTGKDVFFRSKDFDPHSAAGQELIGHELTHVVQQAQGLSEPAGRPGDRYEQEADQVAAAVFGRETSRAPGVQGKAEGLQAELQRQSEPEEEEELQPQVQAQEEVPEEEV
jgi:hypothetical protein